jgi:DNA-binding PadR family transcriptional regulator
MYKTAMLAKDLVAASSKPLVLSILAEGESYGYEIIKRVRELSGGRIEWSDGMLYPVLHRLEGEGLIRSEWKEADTGRERKYYRINSKGRQNLADERGQWLAVHNTLCKLWKINPVSISMLPFKPGSKNWLLNPISRWRRGANWKHTFMTPLPSCKGAV